MGNYTDRHVVSSAFDQQKINAATAHLIVSKTVAFLGLRNHCMSCLSCMRSKKFQESQNNNLMSELTVS